MIATVIIADVRRREENRITQLHDALVSPYGAAFYEEQREKLIDTLGYDAFRAIQREAFARICKPR